MRERAAIALILASLLGCGRSEVLAASPEAAAENSRPPSPSQAVPQFVVSSDPAEPIIRVTIRPTFLIGVPGSAYTLYGDGRLELAQTSTPTYVVRGHSPRSVALDAQESHELITLAAAPVLIEGDAQELGAEFESAGAGMPDGSVVEVEIRLTSYSRGTVNVAPVERRFRMVEPTLAAKHGHGGKGVQALAAVVNGLHRLYTEKEKAQ